MTFCSHTAAHLPSSAAQICFILLFQFVYLQTSCRLRFKRSTNLNEIIKRTKGKKKNETFYWFVHRAVLFDTKNLSLIRQPSKCQVDFCSFVTKKEMDQQGLVAVRRQIGKKKVKYYFSWIPFIILKTIVNKIFRKWLKKAERRCTRQC